MNTKNRNETSHTKMVALTLAAGLGAAVLTGGAGASLASASGGTPEVSNVALCPPTVFVLCDPVRNAGGGGGPTTPWRDMR